jgi:hypothetical protein
MPRKGKTRQNGNEQIRTSDEQVSADSGNAMYSVCPHQEAFI